MQKPITSTSNSAMPSKSLITAATALKTRFSLKISYSRQRSRLASHRNQKFIRNHLAMPSKAENHHRNHLGNQAFA